MLSFQNNICSTPFPLLSLRNKQKRGTDILIFKSPVTFIVTVAWGYQVVSFTTAGQTRPGRGQRLLHTARSDWHGAVSLFGAEQRLVLISPWAMMFHSLLPAWGAGRGSSGCSSRKGVRHPSFSWMGNVCPHGCSDLSWAEGSCDQKRKIKEGNVPCVYQIPTVSPAITPPSLPGLESLIRSVTNWPYCTNKKMATSRIYTGFQSSYRTFGSTLWHSPPSPLSEGRLRVLCPFHRHENRFNKAFRETGVPSSQGSTQPIWPLFHENIFSFCNEEFCEPNW